MNNHERSEAATGNGSDLNILTTKPKVNQFSDRTALQHLKELHIQEQRRKYPTLPYYTCAKFTDKTSNGLTRGIIMFLRWQGHQAERNSTEGRILDQRQTVTDYLGNLRIIGSIKRIRSSQQRGTADISCTIYGRSVKIEVKCSATHDKQRPAQQEYQRQVEAAGGLYVIATSFSQFLNWYYSLFSSHE